jgi:hypothetical protein
MTTSYYADRISLLYVLQQHPDWTQPKLAQALGRSASLGKKMAATHRARQGSW